MPSPQVLTPPPELAEANSPIPPWKRSWFYCQPGEWMTLMWVIIIHVALAAGIVLVACRVLPLPAWPVWAVAYALLWLGGIGTTVAYHRGLAHRAVRLNRLVESALIFFAMFNGSGNPVSWVGDHRHHHAHSDREGDISSPRDGFWWAHLRWLWQADHGPAQRLVRDLDLPRYRFWPRLQVPILALSLAGGLALAPWIGWPAAVAAALVLGPLRLVFALHVQCTVNSVCHLGKDAEHGTAMNVWWLAFAHMGHGENWHGNHHDRPSSPRLGYGWSQVDVGWWVIRTLGLCGLAGDLKSTGSRG